MTPDDPVSIDIKARIGDVEFPNPLLLASGIADETGMSMAQAVKHGAGGVVTKSLSLDERSGHPNPCIYELPYGMLNAMGLPNPGIEAYMEEIDIYLKESGGGYPMIASVFGSTIEDYGEAAARVTGSGVEAIEINGSCPNAKGLGLQFGQDPDVISDLVSHVRSRTDLPVYFKLTPNTDKIVTLAQAAEDGGADAVVAINTVQAMKIDIHSRRPLLTNVTGGLSGPAIKPIGVRCVFDIARDVDIPIIAVGGATTTDDVIEYILAGANAVQVGTAVTWSNLSIFSEMRDGLKEYMSIHGFRRIEDMVGLALEVK